MASTSSITQRLSDGPCRSCRGGIFSCLCRRMRRLLLEGWASTAGWTPYGGLRVAAAAITLFILKMSGCGEECGSPGPRLFHWRLAD
jgi:hypothetical protein